MRNSSLKPNLSIAPGIKFWINTSAVSKSLWSIFFSVLDSKDFINNGNSPFSYVTTVGLYDDDYNLLVVGKLGQPIKASSETDTTFVIRFDTW